MMRIANDGTYSDVTEREIEVLQSLAASQPVPTTTPEFANLKSLGLIFIQDGSGLAKLTPLGKAWLTAERLPRRTP